jgi:hypothetical protein
MLGVRRIVSAAGLVLAFGCGAPPPHSERTVAWVPDPAPDLGAVVARVGEAPIFAAEVEAQVARSGTTPKQALDELIAFHLLAEKARASGVRAEDFAAVVPQELLVQRLLEREFEPVSRASDVGDEELRRLYERGKDTYVHPRLVEVGVLAIYTGDLMKPARRAQLRTLAQALADEVGRRPLRTPEDLAVVANDPRWSGRIALRRLLQGPDRPFGPALGAAVMRLAKPGDTTPLVEDPSGLYLARYISERPAENVAFEAVREQLRAQVYPYWRQQRFAQLVAGLAKHHEVEAYPSKLTEAAP